MNEFYSGFLWPLISALAGAGAGSISAYQLNRHQIRKSEKSKEIGIIAQVIFDLEQMLNDVLSAKNQLIIPFESNALRFMDITPVHGDSQYIDAKTNPELAAIVLRYKEPKLTSLVNISIKRYKTYISQSKLRGGLYKEAFKILGSSHKWLTEINIYQLSESLGRTRVLAMYHSTENYISTIDDTAITLYCSICSLVSFLEKNFDGEYSALSIINNQELMNLLQHTSPPILSEIQLLNIFKRVNYNDNFYNVVEANYNIQILGE